MCAESQEIPQFVLNAFIKPKTRRGNRSTRGIIQLTDVNAEIRAKAGMEYLIYSWDAHVHASAPGNATYKSTPVLWTPPNTHTHTRAMSFRKPNCYVDGFFFSQTHSVSYLLLRSIFQHFSCFLGCLQDLLLLFPCIEEGMRTRMVVVVCVWGGGGCHRDCTAVCVLCTPPCITWTQPRQISGFFVHLNVLWRTEIICNDFLLH